MRRSTHEISATALFCLWVLALSATAFALAPFDASLPANSRCAVPVSMLRPTQCSVGMEEVAMRAKHLRELSPPKLQKYLDKKVAPIVIGPGGVPYLLDHHHLARALLVAGLTNSLVAEVKENWSKLPEPEFWTKMKEQHWVYLRDEAGRPISDPQNLPPSIQAMHDDPYRSLSWLVREQGGYRQTEGLFADFQWADFFRARIQLGHDTNALDQATAPAVTLAHSPEARDLPGYVAAAASPSR
ncbi:MAG TPA: ParB-like protein [Verrucomicrobiae bacterium]|nr:ParB-like protein [Verrucomicrobiae bacterium]